MYGGWLLHKERRYQAERKLSDVIFGWEGSSAVNGRLRLELE